MPIWVFLILVVEKLKEDIHQIYCTRNKRWSGYFRERNKMMVSLILATGLRRAEAAALRVDNIEFRPIGTIVHVIGGKGDKDREVLFPISSLRHGKYWIKHMSVYSEYLFPSYRGGPIGIHGISLVFQQISRRTNMHIHAHLLRHTYASTLVQKGVITRNSTK